MKIELFEGLPSDTRETVVKAAISQRLRGGFFFRQGEPADRFFVLAEGQVKITQLTRSGNQVLLEFIEPGEMFGGVAIFGGATYPASAEAVGPCLAWKWDKVTISRLTESYPFLAKNVMRLLSERMKGLQDRYRDIATENVPRRLARILLRLSHHHPVELHLSRQDLAEMTGTTLYTVSRILTSWKHKGFVDCGRRRLVIRKPDGLVLEAEEGI